MEGNEKDLKIRELTDKVEFLSSIIIKAHKYAKDDPEVALTQARKSAEAICRNIFSAEIGEPGKIMLDELIKKLAERKIFPTKILVPLGTIQAYGNYGTHAQSASENIDFNYITPCLSALAQVSSWYFTEYLKTNIPADLAAEEKDTRETKGLTPTQGKSEKESPHALSAGGPPASAPKKFPVLWIGLGAGVVAIILAIVFLTGNNKTDSSNIIATPDTAKSAAVVPPGQPPKDSVVAPIQKPEEPTATRKEPGKEKEGAGKGPSSNPITAKEKAAPASTQAPQTTATADVDPTVLKEFPATYPVSMQGAHVDGEVRVRVFVDANGNPTEARILSYDDERFQQAAIDAAMHYKFNPGLAVGKPVPAWATVRVQFKSK